MEDSFYEIEYKFTSELNEIEGNRYITTYSGNVFETNDFDEGKKLIGKISLKLILLSLATNQGYSSYEIFDTEGDVYEIGQEIFDFKSDEIKEDIRMFYEEEIFSPDICIIQRIEIIEKYRGQGLGSKIIKDIYNRFASCCGLFVLKVFPLQFDSNFKKLKNTAWGRKLSLEQLGVDKEGAFYRLKAYYQKLGFNHIEGYEELMFINPYLINGNLDAVKIE